MEVGAEEEHRGFEVTLSFTQALSRVCAYYRTRGFRTANTKAVH